MKETKTASASPEARAAMHEMMAAFEAFKGANDARLDEIEALARYLWDNGAKAYGSYGKLRGWCDNVGWLPPLPEGL